MIEIRNQIYDGFGGKIFNITLLRYLYDKVYATNEKEHVTLHL